MTRAQPIVRAKRFRLPRVWKIPKDCGTVHQANIRLAKRGRLTAKLLIFETQGDLARYWKHINPRQPLGRGCLGAVNSLMYFEESFGGKHNGRRVIWVDARYFCVIGLVRKHLTMRVISHESVHAAFAYAGRKARSWWDTEVTKNPEEEIAYPTGEIASSIVYLLNQAGYR